GGDSLSPKAEFFGQDALAGLPATSAFPIAAKDLIHFGARLLAQLRFGSGHVIAKGERRVVAEMIRLHISLTSFEARIRHHLPRLVVGVVQAQDELGSLIPVEDNVDQVIESSTMGRERIDRARQLQSGPGVLSVEESGGFG